MDPFDTAVTICRVAGLNPYQEAAQRSFKDLLSVVHTLRENGLDDETGKAMEAAVNIANSYIHSHFRYNLGMESEVATHCVSFALSDPTCQDDEYRRACSIEHSRRCLHCDAVQEIFKRLVTGLEVCKANFTDEVAVEKCSFAIEKAEEKINEYIMHAIRAFGQNYLWQELRLRVEPDPETVVFATSDFAMKVNR